MPANILNLPAYIVTNLVENEYDYHIDAEAKHHPTNCQVCGSPDIVGFGRNEQLVRDLTIHGKQRRGLMHDRFILLKREAKLEGLDRITLESWTKNYPALGEAYRAKEEFFGIYDAMTVQEAIGRFKIWETGLDAGDHGLLRSPGHQCLHRKLEQPDQGNEPTGQGLQL